MSQVQVWLGESYFLSLCLSPFFSFMRLAQDSIDTLLFFLPNPKMGSKLQKLMLRPLAYLGFHITES